MICTYTKKLPDSQTAWQFVPQRPDTDHFNRDYLPNEARGGAEIFLLDPFSGQQTGLTSAGDELWDFRAVWSLDGSRIAFCRSAVGESSALWVMNSDGSGQSLLTYGPDGMGVDHPVWID